MLEYPPGIPVLSQMNSFYIITLNFSKTLINIMFKVSKAFILDFRIKCYEFVIHIMRPSYFILPC